MRTLLFTLCFWLVSVGNMLAVDLNKIAPRDRSPILSLSSSSSPTTYAKSYGHWGQYKNGPSGAVNMAYYAKRINSRSQPQYRYSRPYRATAETLYYSTNPYSAANSYGRFGP